jgi:hypothetical protein
MATVTPNFNWPVPTSTDLVKDGATAIEALGDSIDASLVDLKGGTTGQVLSKTSGTDMDFTWVTSDDANAIQNTIVDAKGDLIAASAADTPARLAVGNNGESLVADSSTSTGLRYQAVQTRNIVFNSAFDIWQRGTSGLAINGGSYTADRWYGYASVTGRTVSRQTGDTGFNYCARVQRDSGNTNTSSFYFGQPFEIIDATKFAGKTIVWSFYARAGANFSPTSSNLDVVMLTGTGTVDSNAIVAGYTGQTSTINTNKTLTTSWQRFSVSATIPTNVTQFTIYFGFNPTGTAGANDWFEVTGVQLETGNVPDTFVRQGGSIQGELDACQRYYMRNSAATSVFTFFSNGFAFNTTTVMGVYTFPVTMRIGPTLETSGTASNYRTFSTAGSITCSAVPLQDTTSPNTISIQYAVASGLTAGQGAAVLANNSAAAYLGFNAEL